MTAVRCRNRKCGAERVETLSARYGDDARRLRNPSIFGIVIGTIVLFCTIGVAVAFIGAVVQSNQGRPVEGHLAIALVGLWFGSAIWWARSRIQARRRFSAAPTTFAHHCLQCGYRWSRFEGGARGRTRAHSDSGAVARAARTLEAAEQRRWRDSAAWGDYYHPERNR